MSDRLAQPWRQGTWIVLLGLALVAGTLACYWPAGRMPFLLYEDPATVSQNPMIQQGVTWSSFAWAFKSIVTCNWQPLTSLSHMLDWQLWESDAGKHHLVNVFIHAANVLLLFLVLRRMTGAMWCSAFVAALFGWHPMHVESVAWISERKDMLSAFFFLLTLWAYSEYAKSHQKCMLWYLLSLFFFALGLMSKPNIVTLPFVLLLLDYWPLQRFATAAPCNPQPAFQVSQIKWLLLEKLPFLVLSIADCIITIIEQKAYGSLPTLEMTPAWLRLGNALASYAVYLEKLFWPANMGVFYLLPHSIPTWQIAGAALLLAGITALVIWQLRKHPYLAVGWFWFTGMLVPMIGLVQTGMQSHSDHHTYLPYIGLGLMLAWGLPVLLARASRYSQHALAIAAIAALTACWLGTRAQLKYWHDSITLFQHTVDVTSANEAAHNMLGSALLQAGRRDDAAAQFQATLQIQPHYPTFRSRACDGLGLLNLQQHKLDDAIEMLSEAIKLRPDSADAYFNLGAAYGQKGDLDHAAVEFQHIADMPPGNNEELNNAELQTRISRALIRCGKTDEALKHCHDLVAAHRDDPAFHAVLAAICDSLNQHDEAIKNLNEAIRLAPKTAIYMNQLAGVLATCPDAQFRNGAQAVKLAECACELTHHRNATFLDTLGMAYAEAGRFPEAITATEEARTIALASQDQRTVDNANQKLDLYRAGMHYHESSHAN